MNSFGEEVPPCVFSVYQIEIRNVVHHSTIRFFGYVFVKAAIPGLHVVHGYAHTPGHECCNRAICVAENQHGVWSLECEDGSADITVPFAWETAASGVQRTWLERARYRRSSASQLAVVTRGGYCAPAPDGGHK